MIIIGIGIVLLAGILYLAITFLGSDDGIKEQVVPHLEFADMQVTNLTAERADMDLNMIIDNPAPVGINIDSLYYTIFIEGYEVVKTTYPDPIQIEANQNTRVSLPLTIYYDKLQSVLVQLEEEGRDSVVYTINAILITDAALIPDDRIKLEVKKRLPLVRIPEIKVTDLNVENISFSGAVIQVETYVVNRNVFSMGFEDMHYSLILGDNEPVEGHKPEPVTIEAKDTAFIQVPVELDFGEMGRGLLDYIRKGGDLPYNFSLRTKLASDTHILEESEMNMQVTGTLDELGEVVEEQLNEEE